MGTRHGANERLPVQREEKNFFFQFYRSVSVEISEGAQSKFVKIDNRTTVKRRESPKVNVSASTDSAKGLKGATGAIRVCHCMDPGLRGVIPKIPPANCQIFAPKKIRTKSRNEKKFFFLSTLIAHQSPTPTQMRR